LDSYNYSCEEFDGDKFDPGHHHGLDLGRKAGGSKGDNDYLTNVIDLNFVHEPARPKPLEFDNFSDLDLELPPSKLPNANRQQKVFDSLFEAQNILSIGPESPVRPVSARPQLDLGNFLHERSSTTAPQKLGSEI
jgi:hypothetical protein